MGRKVRMITITEENMPAIAGRLKKFFEREDKVIFNSWDFNCGFKKYIKPTGVLYNYYDSSTFYVEYVPKVTKLDVAYIELYFGNDDYFLLDVGDKVAFLGDRIITSTTSGSFWQYDMWQILPENHMNIL